MGEIVYTFDATGDNKKVTGFSIAVCGMLMFKQHPFTVLLMEHLRIATADLEMLSFRLEREKEMTLTEKQLITVYAVLKIANKALQDETMLENLPLMSGPEEILFFREKLFEFSTITGSRLKHECAHLPRFSTLAEKIDEAARI